MNPDPPDPDSDPDPEHCMQHGTQKVEFFVVVEIVSPTHSASWLIYCSNMGYFPAPSILVFTGSHLQGHIPENIELGKYLRKLCMFCISVRRHSNLVSLDAKHKIGSGQKKVCIKYTLYVWFALFTCPDFEFAFKKL